MKNYRFLKIFLFLAFSVAFKAHAISFSGSTATNPDTDGIYKVVWTTSGYESGPFRIYENGVIKTDKSSAGEYSVTGKSNGTYLYDIWGYKLVFSGSEPRDVFQKLGSYTVNVSIVPQSPNTPAKPTSVGSTTNTSYRINWTKPGGTSATSYKLRRRLGSGSWSQIYSGSNLYFDDSGRTPGSWYYSVSACAGTACSAYSTDTLVTVIDPRPGTPSAPTAPNTSNIPYFTVSWAKPSGVAPTSYQLRRKLGAGSWQTIYNGAALNYAEEGRAEGDWYYDVIACNGSYCSGDSVDKKVVVDYEYSQAITESFIGPILTTNADFIVTLKFPGSIRHDVYENGRIVYNKVQSLSDLNIQGPVYNLGDGVYRYTAKHYIYNDCFQPCNNFIYQGDAIPFQVVVASKRVVTLPEPNSKDGTYQVRWNSSAGVGVYQIQENSGSWVNVTNFTESNGQIIYTYSNKSDGTYTYRVRACLGGQCNTPSDIKTVTVLKTPTTPTAFTQSNTSVITDGNVRLSWQASQQTINEYRITESGVVSNTYTTASNRLYLNLDRVKDGNHTFSVQACNASGCSASATLNAINVLKIPLIPNDLNAAVKSQTGEINLSWAAPTDSAVDFYEVAILKEGELYSDWELTGTTRSYNATNLPDGNYQFRVHACNNSGCGVLALSNSYNINHPTPVKPEITASGSDSNGQIGAEWSVTSTAFIDVYHVRIDSGTWLDGGLALNYIANNISQGDHTIDVRACNRTPGATKCSAYDSSSIKVSGSKPSYADTALPFASAIDDASFISATGNHDATSGVVTGEASVSGGQASYTIPIPLPPGRADIAPEVSINYGGSSGNSTLGMGWQMSAGGAISRCPSTLVHDGINLPVQYKSTDKLCYNGQRLLLNSGTYGNSGATYYPESDRFTVVTQTNNISSGSSSFTVKMRDGSVSSYGTSANSRVFAGGKSSPTSWLMADQKDLAGNYIHYTYQQFGSGMGEYHIQKIEYTGTVASHGDRRVEFSYENRPDVTSAYLAGGLTVQSQRIRQISTYYQNTKIREFNLSYKLSDASERSLLTAVEDCAYLNSQKYCVPKTEFTWLDSAPQFELEPLGFKTSQNAQVTQFYTQPEYNIQKLLPRGDANGDGILDWSGWQVNAEGVGNYSDELPPGKCYTETISYSVNCIIADFDNDGRTDLWRVNNNKLQILLSRTGKWVTTSVDLPSLGQVSGIVQAADYNGDGLTDIVTYEDELGTEFIGDPGEPRRLYLWFHTGNFSNPYSVRGPKIFEEEYNVTFTSISSATNATPVGDVNGDGVPDFLVNGTEYNAAGVSISPEQPIPMLFIVSSISSSGEVSFSELDLSQYLVHLNVNNYFPNLFHKFLDINGDGALDWIAWSGNNSNLNLALNKGDGSFTLWQDLGSEYRLESKSVEYPTGRELGDQFNVTYPKFSYGIKEMDYDADGRVDLLVPNGLREVTACSIYNIIGGTENICGEEFFGQYQTFSGQIKTALPSIDYNDNSVYHYDVLKFKEISPGVFRVRGEDSGIVGSAAASLPIGAFGNGLTDFIFSYGLTNSAHSFDESKGFGVMTGRAPGIYINRNRGSAKNGERYQPIDMLESVENGFGVRSEWTYRPLSSQDSNYHSANQPFYEPDFNYLNSLSAEARAQHYHFTSNMYVVAEFRQSNGVGDNLNRTQYRYKGAMYNWQGRGFQGFRTIITEDLDAEITSRVEFHQVYPLAGRMYHMSQYEGYEYNNDNAPPTPFNESKYEWRFWPAGQFNSGNDYFVNSPQVEWQTVVNVPYIVGQAKRTQTKRTLAGSLTYSMIETQNFDQWGRTTSAETKYQESGGHIVRSSTTSSFDDTYINDGWWDKPIARTTTQHAVESRKGVAIDSGTDADQTTTMQYNAWDIGLRKPTNVTAVPVTGKSVQTATEYNQYGLPTWVSVNSSGETERKTATVYSNDGYFVARVTNPEGHLSQVVTDPKYGVPTQTTDANGITSTVKYDAFGRAIETRVPGLPPAYSSLQMCSNVSCPPGLILQQTSVQAGTPTTRVYLDKLGRAVRTDTQALATGQWIVQAMTYNKLGQEVFMSSPAYGAPSSYGTHYVEYDVLGRLTEKTMDQTDGQVLRTTYEHEAGEGFTTNINAGGNYLSRTYNGLQQLTETVDAVGTVTRYAYTGAGQPIVMQDGNGNRITAKYNDLGQKLWVDDPNMGRKNFAYTGFGEIASETDANGDTKAYTYDRLGRTINRRINGSLESTWEYDGANHGIGLMNAERLSNGAFERSYYYDSLSRPISVNTQIDGETYTVNSYYDANYGRPKGMRYPGGLTVQYGYSSTGYLTTTQNASSGYIYRKINNQDAFGNWLQADLAAGVLTQDRNYDEATGQLRAAMLSQITGVIHKQTYDNFDHFGNLTQMSTELAGSTYTESFSYDDMHRLLQNNRSNGPTINYSYDAVGNLLSKSDFANNYQYNGSKPNAVSQVSLISGATKTYGYDNNGNRTKENGVTTAYYNTYNHPTRLIKGSADLRFFYAPDLSRYKQTNGAKTTVYIDKLFEKITDTGKTQYRYFIDEIAVLTETETASDTQQEIVFTHRDRLGSTVAMADDLGMAVETHSFDPFGKPRDGDLSDKLDAVLDSQYTTRGFTDHEHLDDVELIHMNGRVYDYNLGRFLSVDPVIQSPGNSQSMNPYSYIMNNPLAGTDPSGYCGSNIDGVEVSGCKTFSFGGDSGGDSQKQSVPQTTPPVQNNGAQQAAAPAEMMEKEAGDKGGMDSRSNTNADPGSEIGRPTKFDLTTRTATNSEGEEIEEVVVTAQLPEESGNPVISGIRLEGENSCTIPLSCAGVSPYSNSSIPPVLALLGVGAALLEEEKTARIGLTSKNNVKFSLNGWAGNQYVKMIKLEDIGAGLGNLFFVLDSAGNIVDFVSGGEFSDFAFSQTVSVVGLRFPIAAAGVSLAPVVGPTVLDAAIKAGPQPTIVPPDNHRRLIRDINNSFR
ncbi:FG-GAP-like repeat-containing protein [Sessilibacter sp. MAH4]